MRAIDLLTVGPAAAQNSRTSSELGNSIYWIIRLLQHKNLAELNEIERHIKAQPAGITMERMYGTIDGKPATWVAGVEAWWMPNYPDSSQWIKIDSIDASWNAAVMTKAEFDQAFPDVLARLPSSAFQDGESAS